MRDVLARIARIALALAILAWLVRQVGIGQILDHLAQTEPRFLMAALLVVIAESFVKVAIWREVLRGVLGRRRIGFGRLSCCYFAGSFLGTAVPSSAGTDALRLLLSYRHFGGHIAGHAASIVSANAVNWFAGSLLALIALIALAAMGSLPSALIPVIPLFGGILLVVPVAYWLLEYRRDVVIRMLRLMPFSWMRLRHGLRKFLDGMLIFERARVGIGSILLLALLAMILQPIELMLTAAAVDVHAPFLAWMVIAPLSAVISVLPLNVAGFGILQAAHVYLITLFGGTASEALVISALLALQTLALNVIGGVIFAVAPDRGALGAKETVHPGSVSS